MSLARRCALGDVNPIARRREELLGVGIELTDMTDTNPTHHGLFDPQILEVLDRHLPRIGRYEPTPRGPWPARAALADRFGGDPEDYWLTASTSEAYSWLFSLLGDPGDCVAIPSPGYPLIEPIAIQHALSAANYRTLYAHPTGWELDTDSLTAALSKNTVRAVVAVNPNNPTGAYVDDALLATVANRSVPLIADEVFFPFHLREDMDHPPQRLSGTEATLTFSLDGLSKLLAAPQLKLGWIRLSGPITEREAAEQTLDQIADRYLSVNALTAQALPDLLTLADSSINRVTTRLRTNLTTIQELFPHLRIRTSYGGWMVLLDIPPIMEADSLCIALMERAGLSVHPGYFYDLEDSTLAISLLPQPAQFSEACQRLLAAVTVLADEYR
ncbi:MAG: pyridoxal phosphate-dependent aminotransferase [Propionibacteriaceae bacterium]|nr:pyridoxal phosphate-dependent aminotransferase [Propionibacteriaceae bacterium]